MKKKKNLITCYCNADNLVNVKLEFRMKKHKNRKMKNKKKFLEM